MYEAEDKLKILLRSKWILCGSMLIDALDTPFDYGKESQWSIHNNEDELLC